MQEQRGDEGDGRYGCRNSAGCQEVPPDRFVSSHRHIPESQVQSPLIQALGEVAR
jgi:hypothetical protein